MASESPEIPTLPTSPLRVFSGRVLPERAAVQLRGLPDFLVRDPSGDDIAVRVHIDSSQVVVETRGGASVHADLLRERIRTFVAMFVDALGFVNGCGYQVELSSVGGLETGVYGVRYGDGHADEQAIHDNTMALIAVLLSRPDGALLPLQRSLADYRRALLDSSDTPFHAFRAVESLAYFFDRNPRRGTPKLLDALNIAGAWLQSKLEIPAGEVRHGKARPLAEEVRLEALRCSREVIHRFVAYLRLNVRLSEPDFPKLVLQAEGAG